MRFSSGLELFWNLGVDKSLDSRLLGNIREKYFVKYKFLYEFKGL